MTYLSDLVRLAQANDFCPNQAEPNTHNVQLNPFNNRRGEVNKP